MLSVATSVIKNNWARFTETWGYCTSLCNKRMKQYHFVDPWCLLPQFDFLQNFRTGRDIVK